MTFSNYQALLDDRTQWTTRYGCIAGLAELGHDVSLLHSLSTITVFNALEAHLYLMYIIFLPVLDVNWSVQHQKYSKIPSIVNTCSSY